MTFQTILFYLLAALILCATGLAVTRRNLVHAVVYLVMSFFGSALLFYLLGAPLLAALEVIIYAGAIMVLFVFIIMMLGDEALAEKFYPRRQWLPAAGMAALFGAVGILTVLHDPAASTPLQPAVASPARFGHYVFKHHWLAIEIVSLLLLVALIGALLIARRVVRRKNPPAEEPA
ncbi:MAG: NADH-quinone oxidoreductase subunit J [Desulfobacterales bacterium]|jgi:NADH-quinone oxidoreductase subunit J